MNIQEQEQGKLISIPSDNTFKAVMYSLASITTVFVIIIFGVLIYFSVNNIITQRRNQPLPEDDPSYFLGYDPNLFVTRKSGKLQATYLTNCLEGKEPSCYFQNPTTPYCSINFLYPIIPNYNNLSINASIAISTFTLIPNELVILYGEGIPDFTYWGFTPYLVSDEEYCNGELLLASIADTANNINTQFTKNKKFVIIFGTNTQLITQFKSSIDPSFEVYLVQFPSFSEKGRLLIVGRTAIPVNQEEADAFYRDTKIYGSIIQYYKEVNPSYTVTSPTFIPRNSFFNEHTEGPTDTVFEAESDLYLTQVLQTIPSDYQYVHELEVDLFLSSINYDNGYDCIENCVLCQIDNRDTVYTYSIVPYLITPNQDIVVIFGVNHSIQGKSLYTNVSVYNYDNDSGLVSEEFLSTDSQFYNFIISPNPITVPENTDTYILPPNVDKIIVGERAYIQTIGPNGKDNSGISSSYDTLIKPRVWVISTIPNPPTYEITKTNHINMYL